MLRENLEGNYLSLMCSWPWRRMVLSAQRCTGSPHTWTSFGLWFPPLSSTQESSGQNFHVPSRNSLLLWCKLCPGRETHPRLAPEDGYPAEFTLPHQSQWSEEQAAQVSVTIPYIHGLSQSIRRVLSHLAIKVTFRPILNPEARAGPSERPHPRMTEKRCGVQRSLQWVLASLHWTDWQVAGPSHCRTSTGSQEWGCGSFSTGRACVHCWAQNGFIQGNSDQCSPSYPDPLPSWVLAHSAWTDPSQQGKGNIARTLCHPAGLTLFCVSIISSVLHYIESCTYIEACCLIIIHIFLFVFYCT